MTTGPPRDWLELSDVHRDVLVSLDVNGSASANELHDRIGGCEGRESYQGVARNISRLRDAGLVEAYPETGRNAENRLTPDGRELLGRAREWICS